MILPLLALATSLIVNPVPHNRADFSSMLRIENGVLLEVLDKSADDIRIYEKDHVTSIDATAFDGCQFTTIMISNTVTEINAVIPDNVVINYTGSLPAYFDVGEHIVHEYACDEGFIHYWGEYIRKTPEQSICDVKREDYNTMIQLYENLSKDDKEVVDAIPDGDSSIKDSVEFLRTYFKEKNKSNTTKEIAQSTMLTIILVIASIGMTSIGVFYYLKDKNIIK